MNLIPYRKTIIIKTKLKFTRKWLPAMASLDSSWSWAGNVSWTTPAIVETGMSSKKLKPNVYVGYFFPPLYMFSHKNVSLFEPF